jgi:catechol 2,3-dioxygenase-like lactoylglutathione lyase family enzyme
VPDLTGQVHHVNLSVSDLERSASWYAQVFGLIELARSAGDSWSRVILAHPTGFRLGLTQHAGGDGEAFRESRCGLDHFALAVASLEELNAWQARLDELGIERSGIATATFGSLITLRDPDNIQIELFASAPRL